MRERKLFVVLCLTVFLITNLTGLAYANEKIVDFDPIKEFSADGPFYEKGKDQKNVKVADKNNVETDAIYYTYYWKITGLSGPTKYYGEKYTLVSGAGGPNGSTLGASIQASWSDSIGGTLKVPINDVEVQIGRTLTNSGTVTVSYSINVPANKNATIYWQRMWDRWYVYQSEYRYIYYNMPHEFTGNTATARAYDYRGIYYSYSIW
ncbi:hypothetical protein Tfer_2401 [Thermincola ferriacetica]|uniref:Uncharacterized protein n=1 Tax=Thermincola ferriacetica TaxID=281456 RepID=A0A0L6W0L2_9FIRM|nr:hypothetical protein [Thermincola ferriacetica]KNZ68913.1 hypothetical protein Tfer_2401 [Thermincola ferriacetica]